MPKRTAQEKIDYYQYKIRKLAEKVNKRCIEALQTPAQESDEDESMEEFANEATATVQTQERILEQEISDSETDQEEFVEVPPANEQNVVQRVENNPIPEPSPENATSTSAISDQVVSPTQPVEESPPDTQLDSELLTALGEATDDAPKFGPNIHPNLAERWLPLLRKGLTKETKEKLLKEYLVPENCALLQAPKLNAEISAAITEMTRNRDKKMESAQQQLGIGISAINKALSLLLTSDDKVSAIKHLSDSCRILTDLHYAETQTRIKLVTPNLAKPFLNVIQDSERDETLFGNKLPDKIKASKAIERQGLQIKKTVPNSKSHSASTSASTSTAPRASYQYQGNWQGPPRFPSNRGGGGEGDSGSSKLDQSAKRLNQRPELRARTSLVLRVYSK